MNTFEHLESEVRSYCRSFPTVFVKAEGAELEDVRGRRYIDFFAGAGALNYGHNHPVLKEALLAYLSSGGIVHSLDMMTAAKETLLHTLESRLLRPRGLDYKVQFTGPTGTNAVEAALKLARRVTGRPLVVSFTNGFHGMTLGSLSVTGNKAKRTGAGVPLTHTRALPFDGYLGPTVDTLVVLEKMLEDDSSGLELPAAVILETTQAEGGVHVAGDRWLRGLAELCRRHGILLIADDIQVGCGRSGSFFSFERAGIVPDIVCLSKSLSGYGFPLALVLLRREIDVWRPGEHNGTFRGFNPAFVTASTALDHFWSDSALADGVKTRAASVTSSLGRIADLFPAEDVRVRGVGLIRGVALPEGVASAISRRAFELGVIVETAGPNDEVLKLLPPLTIDPSVLAVGLEIVEQAARDVSNRLSTDGAVATEAAE